LKKYSAEIVEICENGDAILQFSEEMIQDLEWKVDDVLSISMKNGAVHLKNITKHPDLFKE
jgi:hypothetical protein